MAEPGRQSRGAGASLGSPREAIRALSLGLPAGGPRVSAEMFRLAKLDQPQARVAFWELLHSLLKQMLDERWTESADPGTQAQFVKSVLWSHGYRRLEFYQLPSDSIKGSRELLFAFSWLLCKVNLMEELLNQRRLGLWDEATLCRCEDPQKSLPGWRKTPVRTPPRAQRDIRGLQWLQGRLWFQWKSRHTEVQEQCRLMHQIHSYTVGCHPDPSVGHLSVTEADIVRRPEDHKQLLQVAQAEVARLEAFLRWKSLEPVYWRWMESLAVPEGKATRPPAASGAIPPGLGLGCSSITQTLGEVDRCGRSLQTLRDKLRKLIRLRRRHCGQKARTGEPDSSSMAASKAPGALERQLPPPPRCEAGGQTSWRCGPYRLVFSGKGPKARQRAGLGEDRGALAGGVTAAEVARELQKKEGRLKAALRQRRHESMEKILEASMRLGQVLLIPPVRSQEKGP